MHDDIAEVLFTEQEIADRVREMGGAITRDYADAARDGGIVLVSVLRGAAIFMADLARKIELPLEMDYMAISSYGNGAKSSGVVRILKDLSSEIEGRHVIVAEDILDSGLTLKYLLKNLSCAIPRRSKWQRFCASRRLRRRRSTADTSASNAPTSSSSGTAWTLRNATATCLTLAS